VTLTKSDVTELLADRTRTRLLGRRWVVLVATVDGLFRSAQATGGSHRRGHELHAASLDQRPDPAQYPHVGRHRPGALGPPLAQLESRDLNS
jgi:hypothetical protein